MILTGKQFIYPQGNTVLTFIPYHTDDETGALIKDGESDVMLLKETLNVDDDSVNTFPDGTISPVMYRYPPMEGETITEWSDAIKGKATNEDTFTISYPQIINASDAVLIGRNKEGELYYTDFIDKLPFGVNIEFNTVFGTN